MRNTALFILAVVTLAACKKEITSNIDQDKIFTHFKLAYDANTDQTMATATFRFSNLDGTRLKLSDPSTVTIDGESIDWNDEQGYYEKTYTGLKPTGVFDWTDLDGKAFSDTVEIRDIDFPDPIPTFSHDSAVAYFTWAGATPLEMNEQVKLEIDGVGETDTRVFSTDTLGDTNIMIDSLKLSQVDSGLVNLFLEKRYAVEPFDGTSAGGLLVGTYRPVDKTTEVN